MVPLAVPVDVAPDAHTPPKMRSAHVPVTVAVGFDIPSEACSVKVTVAAAEWLKVPTSVAEVNGAGSACGELMASVLVMFAEVGAPV